MEKVIATDLDGTLFYPKKYFKILPAKSAAFINRFMDDGGKVVLVSGRNRFIADRVSKKMKREIDMIGCNGAFVYSGGRLIKEDFIPKDSLKKLLSDIEREHQVVMVFLFTKHRNMVVRRHGVKSLHSLGYTVYQMLQGVHKDEVVRSDKIFYEELEKGQVYKCMLMMGLSPNAKKIAQDVATACQEKYPEFSFAFSDRAIEISPKGCTKSSGIAFYLDYNKIKNDNILVVGDSGNDISMFEAYPENSFCMSHAPKDVTSHAKHTIKHFAELKDYIYPSEEIITQTSETKEGK